MPLKGLDTLSAEGLLLLDKSDAVGAHTDFIEWVDKVHSWLAKNLPDTGLTADWASQPMSSLVHGDAYYDGPEHWTIFQRTIQSRLRWLGSLPTKASAASLLAPAALQNEAKSSGRKDIKLQTTARAYVDPDRINELKSISNKTFDLCKLVRLCEEINVCFATECYIAVLMLTRSVIDHVPPIFSCKSFSEVANNYAGSRSFKEAMTQLETSTRKIADHYLHTQIRGAETLPNATQTNSSSALDFLLAEIGRVLK